jgi:hypothetical protein
MENTMTVDLGRRINHDSKNREHALALSPDRGVSVRHRMDANHVDQFYLSGCVGFHVCNMLNCRIARKSRGKYNETLHQRFTTHYLNNNDGIENYHESTLYDPFDWTYPPTDEGSSAVGVMKWLKRLDVIRSYSWTFTFEAFLAALQLQPVGVGSNWYDDMMYTDAKGLVTSNLSGEPGGHQYLANAIVWNKLPSRRLIGYEQTWGEHPEGFEPTFYMPWELAEELIIHEQGDVVVPDFL